MEPKKELTEDQKKRINKIYLNSALRTMWLGSFSGLLLGAANIFIALIAVAFDIRPDAPGADAFVFLSSTTTVILIFRSLGQKIRSNHDTVREEIKKIVEE